MAKCPKCGRKLHVYNWKPYCPGCGANIMFAGYERQFERDKRITEMTLARTRVNFMKFLCAFSDSALTKLRILAALLPVGALFLPFGSFSINTPVFQKTLSINILGVITDSLMGGYLFNLSSYTAGPVIGESVAALEPVLFAYLAVAVIAAILLFIEIFSFISFKKASVVMAVTAVLGIAASAVCAVECSFLSDIAGGVCSAQTGAGVFVQPLSFVPLIVLSLLLAKKGVRYKYAEGDEQRMDYYKKYKKKLIELSDVPYPIYESEKDRLEREKLRRELFNMADETQKEAAVDG